MRTHELRNHGAQGRLVTAAIFSAVLLLGSAAAWSKPEASAETWSEWKAMGPGFAARKREIPPPDLRTVVKRLAAKEQVRTRKGLLRDTQAEALWLNTDAEGLHKIEVPELAALTGQEEKTLRNWLKKGKYFALSNAGSPKPWHYDKGTDALYFVAEAYNTLFTDTNAYRLVKNKKNSATMGQTTGAGPAAGSPGGEFRETMTLEQDNTYALWSVLEDRDADYWFWNLVVSGPGNDGSLAVPLDLPGATGTGEAEMRIFLLGATELVSGNDHRVRAQVNGTDVGTTLQWDGWGTAAELLVTFDQMLLNPGGENTLTLVSEHTPGVVHIQWLDKMEVSYWRAHDDENGKLWLKNLAPGVHTVSGFDAADVRVIQSPAGDATWREDFTVSADGVGGFQVTFEADVAADFLVVQESAVEVPVVEVDEPSKLAKRNNRADYLIIAPRVLERTAESLANYRDQTVGRVQIAWLDDIFDEFGWGREDPQAVSEFLKTVKSTWRRAPSDVVFLGRGTVDHKNRLGAADSLIPRLMTTTPWGLAASDNRYVDTDSDGLMDFVYGRIPVTNDEDGLAYVAKLQGYESAVPAAWMNKAVVVADNPDEAGDFHANAGVLKQLLEGYGYDVTGLYHCVTPDQQAAHPDECVDVRSEFTQSGAWESGYQSYDGHGSITRLGTGSENFLRRDDVASLMNTGTGVFSALTCSAGDDTLPNWPSLTSALVLKPSGGAVASLSPTGWSLDSDAQALGTAFAEALIGGKQSIGEAARLAQQQAQGQVSDFMLEIYEVTGEPRVQVP